MRTSSVRIVDHGLLFEGGSYLCYSYSTYWAIFKGCFYSEVGLVFEDLRYLYILLIIRLHYSTFKKSFNYVSVKYSTDNTIVNY